MLLQADASQSDMFSTGLGKNDRVWEGMVLGCEPVEDGQWCVTKRSSSGVNQSFICLVERWSFSQSDVPGICISAVQGFRPSETGNLRLWEELMHKL